VTTPAIFVFLLSCQKRTTKYSDLLSVAATNEEESTSCSGGLKVISDNSRHIYFSPFSPKKDH
jgi:hypothetical protein